MSVVVSNCVQIANSPLNNSTAKALFSFPKAKKHNLAKKDVIDAFYELPPVKQARSAGFGYGHKYDFTSGRDKTPAPNQYEPKGTLDDARKHKGYSFGVSRESMSVTGGQNAGDRNSPGPAAYNIRGINQKKLAFSFRPRTTTDLLGGKKAIPGPGAYDTVGTISKDGKYFLSKFKNSGARFIAPSTLKRAGLADTKEVPGPGAYNPKTQLSDKGNYYITGFKSSQCRSFGHAGMRSASTTAFGSSNLVPGPGTYRLPSEFGYYEAKNAKDMDQTMRSKESRSLFRSQENFGTGRAKSTQEENHETTTHEPTKHEEPEVKATPHEEKKPEHKEETHEAEEAGDQQAE